MKPLPGSAQGINGYLRAQGHLLPEFNKVWAPTLQNSGTWEEVFGSAPGRMKSSWLELCAYVGRVVEAAKLHTRYRCM